MGDVIRERFGEAERMVSLSHGRSAVTILASRLELPMSNVTHMRFVFSYGEHEPWLAPDAPQEDEAVTRAFLRHLRKREWEQQGPVADDLSDYCDPDIVSLDDLINRARDFFVVENDYPEELVQIPFDKLAALMAHGGWSFAGGNLMEFEGNHNDTEITVVLER
jgi:hypothetical protein